MKKVNFNNLDNIEIPDSWADEAIQVQKNPQKDAPLVLFRVSSTLIAVASIALVCTLSITLYFFAHKDNIIPVNNPTVHISETVTSTKPTQKSPTPEESEKDYDYAVKPTSSKFENPTLEPQENVSETSNSTEKETVKPTQSPSSKPTQKPSIKPTSPTDKPTTPTQEPPTDEIEDGPPVIPEDMIICTGSFDEKLLLGYDKVFFGISPDSDYIADEIPEVSAMHEATIVSRHEGYISVIFSPVESGIVNKTDLYNYYFYNINGDIIYTGQIYITVY